MFGILIDFGKRSASETLIIADGDNLKAFLNEHRAELPKFFKVAVAIENGGYVLFGVVCCNSEII